MMPAMAVTPHPFSLGAEENPYPVKEQEQDRTPAAVQQHLSGQELLLCCTSQGACGTNALAQQHRTTITPSPRGLLAMLSVPTRLSLIALLYCSLQSLSIAAACRGFTTHLIAKCTTMHDASSGAATPPTRSPGSEGATMWKRPLAFSRGINL